MTVWELRRADGKTIRREENASKTPPPFRPQRGKSPGRRPHGWFRWYRDGQAYGPEFAWRR